MPSFHANRCWTLSISAALRHDGDAPANANVNSAPGGYGNAEANIDARNAGSYGHKYTWGDIDGLTNVDGNRNGNRNGDGDSNRHCNLDTNPRSNQHRDAHSHAYVDATSKQHAYSDAVSDVHALAHKHVDRHAHSNPFANRDCHAYAFAHPYQRIVIPRINRRSILEMDVAVL